MSLMNVDIRYLKGIGEKRAELFKKLEIDTIGKLIRNYPRTYEDFRDITLISNLIDDTVCCVKGIVASRVSENRIRAGLVLYKVKVCDGMSSMTVVFFNNKFVKAQLQEGEEYIFRGRVKFSSYQKQMLSPCFFKSSTCVDIRPIYSQTAGLSSKQIELSVKNALMLLPEKMNDPIPEEIRLRYGLCDLGFAIRNIHFPKDDESLKKSKHRVIFEELLVLHLGLLLCKNSNKNLKTIEITEDYTEEFKALLPFSMTGAQDRVICDCINDMINRKYQMRRLIQGDVGSGKTAVCAALCYTVVKSGFQCAVMAPTEILATQHFDWFQSIFSELGIKVALLTGSISASKRRRLLQYLETGIVDICIGTHAILSEGVEFARLGLVVTDEQHRFGVNQRAKLISKGDNPHMLVMSATPIPRTLALIIHGDLDVSILDELPPGRKSVKTFYIDSSKRLRAFSFLKKEIEKGRQCYIVCPVVEENECGLNSVMEYMETILTPNFDGYTFDILHGKMNVNLKNDVMERFSSGQIQILVSTTVVEVGVDVPNASVMLIENAERFGLSQLHQLRGRVGRGKHESFCILVSDAKGEESIKRLNVMCSTNDGFKIADEDLRMRGPGDFFGQRQHGLPDMKIANLMSNIDTISDVTKVSDEIFSIDPNLDHGEHKMLRAEVNKLMQSFDQGNIN